MHEQVYQYSNAHNKEHTFKRLKCKEEESKHASDE